MMRKLLRDQRGVIAVEFAIVAPAFLLMIVGGFDLSLGMMQMNAAQNGLQVGGSFVMTHTSAEGVEGAIKASTNLLAGAAVSAVTTGNAVHVTVTLPVYSSGLVPGMPTEISAEGTFALKT